MIDIYSYKREYRMIFIIINVGLVDKRGVKLYIVVCRE